MLIDLETQERIEVTPEYARTEYRTKIDAHICELCATAREAAGMDYSLARHRSALSTTRSANISRSARGETRWAFSLHGFWRASPAIGVPIYLHLLRQHTSTPQPV